MSDQSNKVVLTQKEVDTVKSYLKNYAKANIVMNVATHEFSDVNPLYQIPFEDLLVAIYRPEDITIEQTVEERLIDAFDQTDFIEIPWEDTKINVQDAYRQGMKKALNIIGMKVKGMNA